MPVTAHGIYYANGTTPHELDAVSSSMASSIDDALNNAHFRTAANYGALPGNDGSYVSGRTHAFTTDDRREWSWNGTRFVLVGGNVPRGMVRPNADVALTTTYAGFQTTADGMSSTSAFTVPPGCGGVYDFGFNARVNDATRNALFRPFVNGAAAGLVDYTSGSQEQFSGSGLLTLADGAVVQFRARVFAGALNLIASSSTMWLAFRSAS